MEQLVISGDVRKNLVTALAAAKTILQRAEAKYASQSKGGLRRAREEVDIALSIVEPTSQDYFAELETAIRALPVGSPGRVSAERSLRALKAQRQRETEAKQTKELSGIEAIMAALFGPGSLYEVDPDEVLAGLTRHRRTR